jgi:four helix bundle protein
LALEISLEYVVTSYRELLVWQKAKSLAVHIYVITERFPRSEVYGLTSQARRAAVSIISNIAEGQGRLTSNEFLHFLGLARGSLHELEAQLSVATDLSYIEPATHQVIEGELRQVLGLLNRLIEAIRRKRSA